MNRSFATSRFLFYPLQPSVLPEEQAPGLATGMSRTIAASVFQMNRRRHAPTVNSVGRIASLMCALRNTKALASPCQHFRHEGQGIQLPILIQCREYFFRRTNFDEIANFEFRTIFHQMGVLVICS